LSRASRCRSKGWVAAEKQVAGLYETDIVLYDLGMAIIPVSEARDRLQDVVQMAQLEAVILQRYGRTAAVLISSERYEQLLEAEDEVEDIAAFDAALAEEGPNIPWEQVKADLGW
jgi:antitoxin Phd